jgi:hypothetical protein
MFMGNKLVKEDRHCYILPRYDCSTCVLKVLKAVALSLIPLPVEMFLERGLVSAIFGVPYFGEFAVVYERAYPAPHHVPLPATHRMLPAHRRRRGLGVGLAREIV